MRREHTASHWTCWMVLACLASCAGGKALAEGNSTILEPVELAPHENKTLVVDLGSAPHYSNPLQLELTLPENMDENFEAGFVPSAEAPADTPLAKAQDVPEGVTGRTAYLRLIRGECTLSAPFSLPVRVRGQWTHVLHLPVQPVGCVPSSFWEIPLLVLLFLGLHIYLRNMLFANARYLSPRELAIRLLPLYKADRFGQLAVHHDQRREVENRVYRGLSWWHRVKAWWSANPLIFGIPGKTYDEVVRIALGARPTDLDVYLEGHRNCRGSRIDLPQEGCVYARVGAGGAVQFLAVPGPNHRIGSNLKLPDGGARGAITPLFPSQRLLPPADVELEVGDSAGWEIGGGA